MTKQQAFKFRTWGGKRAGAGRPQVNERKSQPHRVRPSITPKQVAHVSLRVAPDVRRLRRRDAYACVRRAMTVVLRRTDFRICHASIQANHVHLLVEASDKTALAKGMHAFQVSAARKLNAVEGRRGQMFADRYDAEIISTPRQTRHALAYVINNWRRHKEDRAPYARSWLLDPYSSAVSFQGWAGHRFDVPETHEPLPISRPQGWLLAEGWKIHGLIRVGEVPGRR